MWIFYEWSIFASVTFFIHQTLAFFFSSVNSVHHELPSHRIDACTEEESKDLWTYLWLKKSTSFPIQSTFVVDGAVPSANPLQQQQLVSGRGSAPKYGEKK